MQAMFVLCAIGAAACLQAAEKVPLAADSDQVTIQGNWIVVAGEQNGAAVDVQLGLSMEFAGDKCRTRRGEAAPSESTFALLADTKPKAIDITRAADTAAVKGIYQLEGDVLTLAITGGAGRPRPKEFVSAAGNGVAVLTLKRAPPEQPLAEIVPPSDAPEPAPKAAREPIYNEDADAQADIAKALASAKKLRKHVLVTFGGNWCGWCYRLHDAFKDNEDLARLLSNEFVQVLVDVRSNSELLKRYGEDNDKHGVPFLTVLDADGKVLTNQNTGDLEEGDRHDVAKVREFLAKWMPERLDAENVLKAALEQAKTESKSVLLHVGAPWCSWCHRLDDFLHEQAALVGRDYVDLKIDIDRMENGDKVVERLRKEGSGGVPWMIVLSPDGSELITSDGPEGNIGYPAQPAEIDHFLKMLDTTKKRLTTEDIAKLREALQERAKQYRQ